MSIELPELASSVNTSETLPSHLYIDPAVFELEKDKIFRAEWFPVARQDQLPNPGDYLVHDFFGDEIAVVRDKSGELHAFSNIRLHRACPILQGKGHIESSVVTCPYHKWSYELDGKLRGAPLMDQAVGFNTEGQKLRPVNLELWQGWIFLNVNPDASPLAPTLSELAGRFAPYDVENLVWVDSVKFDSPWNWKIMVENFLESYHHIGVHPETLNPAFPAKGTYGETVKGNYILLENPSIDVQSIAPFWAGCILPMSMFAVIRNAENPYALWYQMRIDRYDHFELELHVLVTKSVAHNAEFVKNIVDLTSAVHIEDIAICKGVWKGLKSQFYVPGRLSHLEACNWQFYNYVVGKLRS